MVEGAIIKKMLSTTQDSEALACLAQLKKRNWTPSTSSDVRDLESKIERLEKALKAEYLKWKSAGQLADHYERLSREYQEESIRERYLEVSSKLARLISFIPFALVSSLLAGIFIGAILS